ncbi:hypothetical protein [Sphingopyxis sp. KK2]|uniref:hypothetical protein n=1 Tax=Sphingopyxis sp. KK2 TaxID=1855727 RepID=UPI00097E70C7|nr:hypothetical protein [Sphingopyxis sp. KK2]
MHRPPSIIAFEWLVWTSALVFMQVCLLGWTTILLVEGRPQWMSAPATLNTILIIAGLGGFGLASLFFHAITRRRSSAARRAYAVLASVGILASFTGLLLADLPPSIMIGSVGADLLAFLSIICAYQPNATRWLTNSHRLDPTTFG